MFVGPGIAVEEVEAVAATAGVAAMYGAVTVPVVTTAKAHRRARWSFIERGSDFLR